jgi:autotransporter-associated beta strand protein
MNSQRGTQSFNPYRSAERRRLVGGGLAIVLAVSSWATASAQTTLYRNSLSSSSNVWTNTAGWSVSGTASKAAPTSVGASDTLVFSNFWTPQRASGLAIWLDAADPNTVVGGTAADAVTQWNDKSGNGRNAVSASDGQATYQVNSQNGNNTLRFNGDSMQAPFVTNPTALTYFMVYQRNGNGPSEVSGFDFYLDIGVQDVTDSSGRFAQLANNRSPTNPQGFSSAVLAANAGRPVGILSSPLNENWNLHASTGVFTTGSQSFSYAINGGVVGTSTGTGANRTGTTVYRIGNGDTWGGNQDDKKSLRANGTIAETLTYSAALSTADRELVEGYLAWKWGTVASLPANHPYKNAAPTAASDTVYLAGNQTAAGLQFATGATTLLGGTSGGAAANSLTLGSGGLTVSAGAGAVTLGAAAGATVSLVLGDSQAWTNISGSLLRAHNGISRAAGDTINRLLTVSGSGNTQLDGVIANGGVSGVLGLTKSGLGRLLLEGANTYSGVTTISGGTLALGAAGTFANSPTITVGGIGSSGAVLDLTAKTGTFSFGSGQTVGGIGTIRMDAGDTAQFAGTFSPGNSPGIITFDGGTAVLSGTTVMEIFGATRGTGYDGVDLINGAVLDYGSGILALDFGSWLADNQVYQLFGSGSSSLVGSFSNVTIAGANYAGLTFSGSNGVWTSQGTSPSGQTLTFTEATGALVIVPEPGAIALAGIGIAAAAYAYRRRRLEARSAS